MTKRTLIALAAALAVPLGVAGCEDSGGPLDQRSDEVGERHEEIVEERLEARGEGPLDRELAGEIAEERGELATEAGQGGEGLAEQPAQTAAQDLGEDDQYGEAK